MEVPTEMNFKAEAVAKESKKRRLSESEMNEDEDHSGLDLELKLSVAGSSAVNKFATTQKSTVSEASLPTLVSLRQYLSSILNIEENFGGVSHNEEAAPLVVMGCASCLMYVMVSKADPKCPKCTNSNLIDEFQVNPAKKFKTSLN